MTQEQYDETLARWGLTPEEAARCGITYVADASAVDASYPSESAVLLPYFRADATPLIANERPFGRVRRFVSERTEGFRQRRNAKYLQPPGTGVQVYLPPLGNWEEIANDTRVPIIITEGEAKAIVGSLRLMPTIALGGVYSFALPNGELHPVLAAIRWEGRPVYLIFDSDAAYNSAVAAAEARLASELFYKRRAAMRIVRLPSATGEKVGLDDYLKTVTPEYAMALLEGALTLRARDSRILELNDNIVWVDSERLVYDRKSYLWFPRDVLTNGSAYGTQVIEVSGDGAKKATKLSVSKLWLTHPLARRVNEAVFRPLQPETVEGVSGRTAINLWEPIELIEGDVSPFLKLTEFLFGSQNERVRGLPVRLMAYKTQNQMAKPALALVLTGDQGSGKSLWAETIRAAFGRYGIVVQPAELMSQFPHWLERGIVAVVNEISDKEIEQSRERLKGLISDKRQSFNEKYRVANQVDSYTFYILVSNNRAVGAYSFDDRRMVVLECPKAPFLPPVFYEQYAKWLEAGGARYVYTYLMNYDLQGWLPPTRADQIMTQSKYMSYLESLTPVQQLAEQMRTADENAQTVVFQWLKEAQRWANDYEISQNLRLASMGRAINSTIRTYQIRPFYTPEELTLIFPNIAMQFMGQDGGQPSPMKLSRELRNNGIRYLENLDDPRGFTLRGRRVQMLVIAQFEQWKAITQATFDELMRSFRTFGDELTAR